MDTSSPTPDTPETPDASNAPEPDFGPSGYLPGRAAKRARKIVLRAPLGVQWIAASVVFGVVVIAAGVLFLRSSGPPQAPYVATVALADVTGDVARLDEVGGTLVLAAGRATVMATDVDLTYCTQARRLVDGDGNAWTVEGRGLGVASLDRFPSTVHEGVVYVDPTTKLPGPPASQTVEHPDCS